MEQALLWGSKWFFFVSFKKKKKMREHEIFSKWNIKFQVLFQSQFKSALGITIFSFFLSLLTFIALFFLSIPVFLSAKRRSVISVANDDLDQWMDTFSLKCLCDKYCLHLSVSLHILDFFSLPLFVRITLTRLQKLVSQLYICTWCAHKACIRLA